MCRLAHVAWLTALVALPLAAQPGGDLVAVPDPLDVGSGTLALNLGGRMVAAPVLEADYEVSIGGMLARTRLQQSFENVTGEWIEGIYVYPLPDSAQVDYLELTVGDRHIRGEIREREQARVEYEQARSAGKRAGLLESERPNLFTTTVANIGPGERVRVVIAYQHNVRYDSGLFSVRIPLVAGPRYVPPDQAAANPDDVSRISPPVRSSQAANPVRIVADIDAGMPITDVRSLYHYVTQRGVSNSSREVELADISVPADRDFVLEWRAAAATPATALYREWHAGSEYSLLQFFPPQGLAPRYLSRDIVFVIDTSGSMDGKSIEQAREALLFALQQLAPGDRFNIIRFASATQLLHQRPVAATPADIHSASEFVHRLTSGGGTEMFPAVHAALRQFADSDESRVRQIVFMTDGNVGNEQDMFALIRAQLGNTRLYTIGIGSAPNGYFMSSVARYGRGSHTFIGDLSEVTDRMTALFEKIAAPVLTDIRIDWPDGAVREIYPQRLTDLFAGEPMLVSIRGPLPPSFTVSGQMAGSPWSQPLQTAMAGELSGVGKRWAAQRIADLLENRHQRASGDPIYDAVVATALDHGLVSRYTSLVAVDDAPVRAPGQPLVQRHVPVNLPAGWRAAGIGGRLPGTATSASLFLAVGLSLLLLALAAWIAGRRTLCAG
jgi:Ca-activated chloride channel family protein